MVLPIFSREDTTVTFKGSSDRAAYTYSLLETFERFSIGHYEDGDDIVVTDVGRLAAAIPSLPTRIQRRKSEPATLGCWPLGGTLTCDGIYPSY